MSGLVLLQPGDGPGYVIRQAALLQSSDLPQAQQIAHPVSSGDVLLFEPSTLRTTNSQGRSGAHGAPVENAEEESSIKANKRQTLFSLYFCLWPVLLCPPWPLMFHPRCFGRCPWIAPASFGFSIPAL